MRLLAVVCLVALVGVAFAANVARGHWQSAPTNPDFEVSWVTDGDAKYTNFTMICNSIGFCVFGWNAVSSRMSAPGGSDYYIGWASDSHGPQVVDLFSNNSIKAPVVDTHQNARNVKGSYLGQRMRVNFTRDWITGDHQDVPIDDTDYYIVWGLGATRPTGTPPAITLFKHDRVGNSSRNINFRRGLLAPAPPPAHSPPPPPPPQGKPLTTAPFSSSGGAAATTGAAASTTGAATSDGSTGTGSGGVSTTTGAGSGDQTSSTASGTTDSASPPPSAPPATTSSSTGGEASSGTSGAPGNGNDTSATSGDGGDGGVGYLRDDVVPPAVHVRSNADAFSGGPGSRAGWLLILVALSGVALWRAGKAAARQVKRCLRHSKEQKEKKDIELATKVQFVPTKRVHFDERSPRGAPASPKWKAISGAGVNASPRASVRLEADADLDSSLHAEFVDNATGAPLPPALPENIPPPPVMPERNTKGEYFRPRAGTVFVHPGSLTPETSDAPPPPPPPPMAPASKGTPPLIHTNPAYKPPAAAARGGGAGGLDESRDSKLDASTSEGPARRKEATSRSYNVTKHVLMKRVPLLGCAIKEVVVATVFVAVTFAITFGDANNGTLGARVGYALCGVLFLLGIPTAARSPFARILPVAALTMLKPWLTAWGVLLAGWHAGTMERAPGQTDRNVYGWTAAACMAAMCFLLIAPLRRRLGALASLPYAACLILGSVHVHGLMPYAIAVAAMNAIDLVMRAVGTMRPIRGSIMASPFGEIVQIKLPHELVTHGVRVDINIPHLSLLRWHAGYVASAASEAAVEVYFDTRTLGHHFCHLQDLANSAPNPVAGADMWVRLDGPTGSLMRSLPYTRYPVVLLVAEEMGLMPLLQVLRTLHMPDCENHHVRDVFLYWRARKSLVTCFEGALRAYAKAKNPNFVMHLKNSEALPGGHASTDSDFKPTAFKPREDVSELLTKVAQATKSPRVAVLSCGSDALNAAVADEASVRSLISSTRFDVHCEPLV